MINDQRRHLFLVRKRRMTVNNQISPRAAGRKRIAYPIEKASISTGLTHYIFGRNWARKSPLNMF
jgi:hypothetical protein